MTGSSLGVRHVLVTGGGTGIGAAIARSAHQAGARVALVGRREAPLAAVAAELGTRVSIHTADVTDADAIRRAVEAAAAIEPVDALVANAGMAESAPFARTDEELWSRHLRVNLDGTYHAIRAVLPAMQAAKRGRIVAVASTAGLKGYPYVAAYCAAKHGIVGLVRALGVELARTGITVNAVCPGFVETEMLERTIEAITAKTGRSEEEARADVLKVNPRGRAIAPSEVAETVRFLLSDGASGITGQAIAIAGGEM